MKPRNILALAAGISLAILASSNLCATFAQSVPPDDFKIGIVDLQRVIDNYKKRQPDVDALEKEFKDKQDTLQKMKTDYEAALEDFKNNHDSMTDEEQETTATKLTNQKIEFESQLESADAEFKLKMGKLKQSLIQDMVVAIQQIGSEENYHLILEADPESRTGVMYHATSLEITSKVIERLNQ